MVYTYFMAGRDRLDSLDIWIASSIYVIVYTYIYITAGLDSPDSLGSWITGYVSLSLYIYIYIYRYLSAYGNVRTGP